MEYEKSVGRGAVDSLKEPLRQEFAIVVIDGTLNVTTVIFVLEPAIYDYCVLKDVFELPIEHVDHRLLGDSREGSRTVIRGKVWQDELMFFVKVHNGR